MCVCVLVLVSLSMLYQWYVSGVDVEEDEDGGSCDEGGAYLMCLGEIVREKKVTRKKGKEVTVGFLVRILLTVILCLYVCISVCTYVCVYIHTYIYIVCVW